MLFRSVALGATSWVLLLLSSGGLCYPAKDDLQPMPQGYTKYAEPMQKDRKLIQMSNDPKVTQFSGSVHTGPLSLDEQHAKTKEYHNLIGSAFDAQREEFKNVGNSKERSERQSAARPMVDTIYKDDVMHFGSSTRGVEDAQNHPKTQAISDACQGDHRSGNKCAEQSAMNQYFKANRKGNLNGANGLAYGQTAADKIKTNDKTE